MLLTDLYRTVNSTTSKHETKLAEINKSADPEVPTWRATRRLAPQLPLLHSVLSRPTWRKTLALTIAERTIYGILVSNPRPWDHRNIYERIQRIHPFHIAVKECAFRCVSMHLLQITTVCLAVHHMLDICDRNEYWNPLRGITSPVVTKQISNIKTYGLAPVSLKTWCIVPYKCHRF